MENIETYLFDDFCICDECKVREYCREIDAIENCIYDGIDVDSLENMSAEDVNELEKMIYKKGIEFKKRRSYKKVK